MKTILLTIGLLILSNAFMTVAWYGHLKHKDKALLFVIAVSWLIALPEYALQVPANRYGSAVLTATQLKVIQEAVSLVVFVGFAWWYLGKGAFGVVVEVGDFINTGDPQCPLAHIDGHGLVA